MAIFTELEPNNTKDQANYLGVISPDYSITIEGTVNQDNNDKYDYFWYKVGDSGIMTIDQRDVNTGELIYGDTFDVQEGEEWFYWAWGMHSYNTTIAFSPSTNLTDLPPPPPDVPPPPPPSFTPGPTPDSPEPSIENQETRSPVIRQGPVTVDHVPAYDQYYDPGLFHWEVNLGCIPTAIASVLGYWDQKNEYDKLFTANGWDELSKTENVADEISSLNHRERYYPNPDNLAIKDTDDITIANFAETSVGNLKLGYGLFAKVPDAVSKYAGQAGKDYSFSVGVTPLFEGFGAEVVSLEAAWDVLTTEINNDRPLVAAVDMDALSPPTADGKVNHATTVVGYDKRSDGNYYGFYDTITEEEADIRWTKFEPMAADVEWGVAALYTIAPGTSSATAFVPDQFDLTLIA